MVNSTNLNQLQFFTKTVRPRAGAENMVSTKLINSTVSLWPHLCKYFET